MIKVNDVKIDSDSEDDTLKDDEVNEVNSATTDVSHTTELLVDDANVVISSPLPTPCPDDDKSKINGLKKLVNIFLYLLLYTYHICWTDLKKKNCTRVFSRQHCPNYPIFQYLFEKSTLRHTSLRPLALLQNEKIFYFGPGQGLIICFQFSILPAESVLGLQFCKKKKTRDFRLISDYYFCLD